MSTGRYARILTVEVAIDGRVITDHLGGRRLSISLSRLCVRDESRSQSDGATCTFARVLEVLEELVAISIVVVTSISRDEDVGVPAHSSRAARVLSDHISHESGVPESVAGRVTHVEREHELEASLLGSLESIVDAVDLPLAAGRGTVWGNPVEREAIDAGVLGSLHISHPLSYSVGIGVVEHEVRNNRLCGDKVDVDSSKCQSGPEFGEHLGVIGRLRRKLKEEGVL
jgi:hypothetical protein